MTEIGDRTVEQFSRTAETSANALFDSFQSPLNQVFELAPKAVAAAVVLVIGFLVAKLFSRAVSALSDKLGLQRAAERGGLAESMRQGGVEKTAPQIVGVIIFWLLMTVFLVAAFEILDLPGMAGAITKVLAYIPKILVATILIVIGLLLASFVRGVIATSADRFGITYAQQLASSCYYIIALMTLIAAFEQLEIKFELLNYAILIVFGAVALAMGLSFGLGGRDVTAGILCGYYVRQRFQSGDHVSIAGLEGTVREVGPVATIIESEENGLMNRRSIPNHLMLKDAVR
jgi:small-conductance mechanosensitive channel